MRRLIISPHHCAKWANNSPNVSSSLFSSSLCEYSESIVCRSWTVGGVTLSSTKPDSTSCSPFTSAVAESLSLPRSKKRCEAVDAAFSSIRTEPSATDAAAKATFSPARPAKIKESDTLSRAPATNRIDFAATRRLLICFLPVWSGSRSIISAISSTAHPTAFVVPPTILAD